MDYFIIYRYMLDKFRGQVSNLNSKALTTAFFLVFSWLAHQASSGVVKILDWIEQNFSQNNGQNMKFYYWPMFHWTNSVRVWLNKSIWDTTLTRSEDWFKLYANTNFGRFEYDLEKHRYYIESFWTYVNTFPEDIMNSQVDVVLDFDSNGNISNIQVYINWKLNNTIHLNLDSLLKNSWQIS